LVEGKSAATVREHFGCAHIPQRFAALINTSTAAPDSVSEFSPDVLLP